MKFEFRTTEEAFDFCKEIAECMIKDFGISQEEAIGRINQAWRNSHFDEEWDIRFHELPETMAYMLYYGPDSQWWKRKGDPTLRPLPYPWD